MLLYSAIAWTEKEHMDFLAGLNMLGKGDWSGISMNFVKTRSPSQVASHAQKFFLKPASPDNKKRRASLFDMPYQQSAVIYLSIILYILFLYMFFNFFLPFSACSYIIINYNSALGDL